VPKP
jgi:exosome complex exonuclease RRP6